MDALSHPCAPKIDYVIDIPPKRLINDNVTNYVFIVLLSPFLFVYMLFATVDFCLLSICILSLFCQAIKRKENLWLKYGWGDIN